jgi:hypothetical protein
MQRGATLQLNKKPGNSAINKTSISKSIPIYNNTIVEQEIGTRPTSQPPQNV